MKIVIVEDNQQLLSSLMMLLNGEPHIEVVGSFADGEAALKGLKDLNPEVMLVDLGLPGMSGVELIQKVLEGRPDLDIMAHTVFDDRNQVFSALRAGASGYILKGCSPRQLIEALDDLYKGGAPMSPGIARAVIAELRDGPNEDVDLISPKEKEILKLKESGLTYKEIAAKLFISPHTVHTHIKHIYEKLQAKNRRDAFLKARKKGLL